MAELSERAEVRLTGGNCYGYATFVVAPGSAHAVEFASDGSVSIEDITGQPLEMGPGLNERGGNGCFPQVPRVVRQRN